MTSIITNRDRDCLGCRLISGAGLIGIGGYMGYQAKRNPTKLGKSVISVIGIGFSAFGIARIFGWPPFKH